MEHVHVTQVNMNVLHPTPPTEDVMYAHVTQVNMNVNTPHPTPQPKTWRSMCMWRKLTRTVNTPYPPDPETYACFQKRARLLARFSPRWLKRGILTPIPMGRSLLSPYGNHLDAAGGQDWGEKPKVGKDVGTLAKLQSLIDDMAPLYRYR